MCRPSGPFLFGIPFRGLKASAKDVSALRAFFVWNPFPGPEGPGKGCFGPPGLFCLDFPFRGLKAPAKDVSALRAFFVWNPFPGPEGPGKGCFGPSGRQVKASETRLSTHPTSSCPEGRHNLCRGREAPECCPAWHKGPKGRHNNPEGQS